MNKKFILYAVLCTTGLLLAHAAPPFIISDPKKGPDAVESIVAPEIISFCAEHPDDPTCKKDNFDLEELIVEENLSV